MRQSNSPFPKFTVDQNRLARRLLSDYRKQKRCGWEDIIAEICELLDTDERIIEKQLSHQSFYYWEKSKKGKMRDSRFQHVFNFLTHPKTLARPKFYAACMLDADYEWKHIGKAIGSFYQTNLNSVYLTEKYIDSDKDPFEKRHIYPTKQAEYEVHSNTEKSIESAAYKIEGLYLLQSQDIKATPEYLCLIYDVDADLIFAHIIDENNIRPFLNEGCDLGSHNGFCYLNEGFNLTLQNYSNKQVKSDFLIPAINKKSGKADHLYLFRERQVFDEFQRISKKEVIAQGDADRYFSLGADSEFRRLSDAEIMAVIGAAKAA